VGRGGSVSIKVDSKGGKKGLPQGEKERSHRAKQGQLNFPERTVGKGWHEGFGRKKGHILKVNAEAKKKKGSRERTLLGTQGVSSVLHIIYLSGEESPVRERNGRNSEKTQGTKPLETFGRLVLRGGVGDLTRRRGEKGERKDGSTEEKK